VSDLSADTEARIVELSGRLDSLVAAWERSIAALRASGPPATSTERRPAADVLKELEDALRDLELHCDEHRRIADAEARVAEDWEQKAMMSIRDGRDGLARQALESQQQHLTSAQTAANEAAAIEVMRDAYRNAVLAVRSTIP